MTRGFICHLRTLPEQDFLVLGYTEDSEFLELDCLRVAPIYPGVLSKPGDFQMGPRDGLDDFFVARLSEETHLLLSEIESHPYVDRDTMREVASLERYIAWGGPLEISEERAIPLRGREGVAFSAKMKGILGLAQKVRDAKHRELVQHQKKFKRILPIFAAGALGLFTFPFFLVLFLTSVVGHIFVPERFTTGQVLETGIMLLIASSLWVIGEVACRIAFQKSLHQV